MISRYFIDRPIFAWVIAITIMLAGALAIHLLPLTRYPTVAPPSVSIFSYYPGANAQTLENSVTQIIEQQLTGLDGYLYMTARSDSSGRVQILVSFQPGTNPDTAQVQVQNRVQQAMSRLPQQVQDQGVTVRKAGVATDLFVTLYDKSGRMQPGDVADFLVSDLQDPISRVTGVGEVQVIGGQYAMRIWLDPFKLRSYALTPSDVQAAIQSQNVQLAAGQIGDQPAPPGQQLNAVVNAQSRYRTADEFKAILLRSNPDGSLVQLKDVARVELGSANYTFSGNFNGFPASGIAVRLAPDANALESIAAVKATVEQLRPSFPPGVDVFYPVDSTPFVEQAIGDVIKTLLEAIVLVVLVMFLFLQNWRATLIPAIAVPVVLLGTFGVLAVFGYSINMLTMFGMVLAIGLLVDDAIVVVENVERIMEEEHLSPKEATRKSMGEITGALIGIGVVLSAVFLPMAFFGGATGIIYRQFSITVVSAMVLSVLVALILTPALCATLLKQHVPGHEKKTTGFFGWFNRFFDRQVERYDGSLRRRLPRRGLFMAIYVLICAGMVLMFMKTPTGFLPDEDQGSIIVSYSLPEGATLEQTRGVAQRISTYFREQESANVDGVFTSPGFSNAGSGQNLGQAFVKLKDWADRPGRENSVFAIRERARQALAQDPVARLITVIVPPAVSGLGNSAGFDLQLQNTGSMPRDEFLALRDKLLARARADENLRQVRFSGLEDQPQLQVDIDRAKAGALGIPQAQVNTLLTSTVGSVYLGDFIDRERVKNVYMQADAPYRMNPEDIGLWSLRTADGSMAPFSSIATSRWFYGPSALYRYNGTPSFNIQGEAAPGFSSGEALQRMEQYVAELPGGVRGAWTGLSYQEKLASGQALALYLVSLLVVFLALAALYESWTIPISVLLVVPLGIVGALVAANLRGLNNDIFFQVGLLTTMGLAAKNAILIVEFAADGERRGLALWEATLQAARLRLRPILMTSLAFGAGVIPLTIASGAGSGSQHAIGTGVIGGVVTGTVLAIFFVPLFYLIIRSLFGRHKDDTAPEPASAH
ncbi:efflux RND transporter permease subunit [Xenophilus sp. Marseille-Q4582]|uniref:efflux RND transporter permease subunit n=1 Tax=Xenophilus sp. Marseille-Q4582 TaxID=2866600 RepID=UPI00272C663B|nr:efflux RND transporter permease subunit [Xenophilus sp. Marseille-Q4582]